MPIASEKTLILTVMRNEGPYILEWVAHHFALGIDDLLVFTNFCTDNTDKILDRLEVLMPHRVKHQPNPKIMFPDRGKWHIMALRYARHFGRSQAADWIYVTDADELLNLKGEVKTLSDLMEATGPADAISFTSVAFNSNGHKKLSPELVSERFTQTSRDFEQEAADGKAPRTAVKTLFRSKIQGAWRPHRPMTAEFSKSGGRWINGSGQTLSDKWADTYDKSIEGDGTRDYAQVNHYSIKSVGEFLLKVDRGAAMNAKRLGASETYWSTANRVGKTDTSGVGLSEDAQALYDEFLSDPILKELHEEAFEFSKVRLEAFLKTEQGETLAHKLNYFDAD